MPHASPRARRAAHYIDTAALALLIRDYRADGRVSEELGLALVRIAGGVWDRYRFTHDREDFVQDVVVHLLQRPLAKADLQKHCFNFLTTCAIRYGMKLRDKRLGDRRRFVTYAAELVDAGRELPSANESLDLGEYGDRTLEDLPLSHLPRARRRVRRACGRPHG